MYNVKIANLYIGDLPNLKKPTLAIQNGSVIHKIASFDSKKAAEEFIDWFIEIGLATDERINK